MRQNLFDDVFAYNFLIGLGGHLQKNSKNILRSNTPYLKHYLMIIEIEVLQLNHRDEYFKRFKYGHDSKIRPETIASMDDIEPFVEPYNWGGSDGFSTSCSF